MKKTIKINFTGMPKVLSIKDMLVYRILDEKYDVQISTSPDYLFFGVNDMYDFCNFNGVRIFYAFECFFPDLNVTDYGLTFTDVKSGDRFHRFYSALQSDYIFSLQNRVVYNEEFIKSKTGFCNFIYSNGGMPARKKIFETVSKYKSVDSAGKFLNNMDGFTPGDRRSIAASFSNNQKIEFQKKYKFSIACENYSYDYYNSEKITDAFYSGTIPIYFGDPKIAEIYNEKAFINCHKYSSFDEILSVIEEIDNNDELFLKMLNEPVYNDCNYVKKQYEGLKEFLFHIFDQPIKKAFRRPIVSWPLIQEKRLIDETRYRKSLWYRINKKKDRLLDKFGFIVKHR